MNKTIGKHANAKRILSNAKISPKRIKKALEKVKPSKPKFV